MRSGPFGSSCKPVIREATFEDLLHIHALEIQVFPDPWPMSIFTSVIRHPDQMIVVAKQNQMVLGYVVLWGYLSEVHILNMGVRPSAQGRGVGKRLLRFVIKHYPRVPRAGKRQFYLEVRTGNHRAIHFYERFGFRALYVRNSYYSDGEDAAVMKLES